MTKECSRLLISMHYQRSKMHCSSEICFCLIILEICICKNISMTKILTVCIKHSVKHDSISLFQYFTSNFNSLNIKLMWSIKNWNELEYDYIILTFEIWFTVDELLHQNSIYTKIVITLLNIDIKNNFLIWFSFD